MGFLTGDVLIRGVNWVGDAVMTMPAIRALRAAMPGRRMTLLVKPWVAGLFEKDPNIDEIMPYDDRWEGIKGKLALSLALRRKSFQTAVLLQNAFEAALLAALAGIPERIGYGRDGRGFLLTASIPFHGEDRQMHHSEYYLNLLEKAGITKNGLKDTAAPWIYLDLEERLKARDFISGFEGSGFVGGGLKRPVIGLNPGAAFGPSKRWPSSKFRELAMMITGELGGSVLVFGSEKEKSSAEEVVRGIEGAVSLAGKTTLRELAALISECDALVSNDSGTMHVGYAVGTPLVALFGSTAPALTGPPEGNIVIKKDVPCSPCFKRECAVSDSGKSGPKIKKSGSMPLTIPCMDGISSAEVFSALKRSVMPSRRAVFFDRDGTLCRNADYLSRWEDFEPFEDGLRELPRLREAGFMLIGVTNQSGIARGLVKEEFVKEMGEHFIQKHGFDAFYYCPHHPDDFCPCRKPSPGMLFSARKDSGIDLRNSYMIGDTAADMLAARAAGAKAILIKTGTEGPSGAPDYVAHSLKDAINHILESEKAR